MAGEDTGHGVRNYAIIIRKALYAALNFLHQLLNSFFGF
jgi:hypothetical protein